MAEKTQEQIEADREAAQAVEKAAADKREAAKEAAANPHLQDANYSGPLTGAQALERFEKFGPLCGRETKPANPARSEVKTK